MCEYNSIRLAARNTPGTTFGLPFYLSLPLRIGDDLIGVQSPEFPQYVDWPRPVLVSRKVVDQRVP